jgi:hypothetical protein
MAHLSRRAALTASMVLAVPIAALAGGASPDAELLALCAEYHAAAEYARNLDGRQVPDAVWLAAERRADDMLEQVAAIPAATLPGLVAKARAAQAYRALMLPPPADREWTEDLAESVIEDLLRLT